MTPGAWGELLDHLAEIPRENGTRALHATAQWLKEVLERSGLRVDVFEWMAHPWRLRILGVGACVAMATYVLLLARKRAWAALGVVPGIVVWLVFELDLGLPVTGWVHSTPQRSLIVQVPAAQQPARERLILSAHYDTKTDLLDHLDRTYAFLASGLLMGLMMVAAAAETRKRRPRLTRVAQVGAVLNGLGLLFVQAGDVLVAQRSPGAVDDGAGCAVLVQAARALHAEPLAHTDVEIVFFSGEELGIEGSRAWVRHRFGPGPYRPTRVLNLDGVGESPRLAVFRAEQAVVSRFPPDPGLMAVVDEAHRARHGVPLHRTFYPALTDARAFLEVGIAALNLSSDLPDHALIRGLHSPNDARHRLREDALDATLQILLSVARRLDAASGAK